MAKEFDFTAFYAPAEPIESSREITPEASIEVSTVSPEVRSKSAKELADEYGVSDRTIQSWFKIVAAAYLWLEPEALKTGKSAKTRYTPLCQELIASYRAVAADLSEEDWVHSVEQAHPEEAAAYRQRCNQVASDRDHLYQDDATEAPAIRPDVLPPIDRTAASSLIPTGGSYLSALEQEEMELQQLEAQELELLDRMSSNLDRLNQNQTQWQRTNDLRRQRLLRQTRLEAAALATELEAEFDETLRESQHNIRRGNVGKSPVAAAPSQSA